MKTKVLTGLVFTLFLQGCSWVEYFAIYNETNENISISYEINQNESDFPIFNANPDFYSLNHSMAIDWNKKVNISDKDTSVLKVTIILPPKTSMIFGDLENDTYKNANQKFINGRYWNLEYIKINTTSKQQEIISTDFDTFFTKTNGVIKYSMK